MPHIQLKEGLQGIRGPMAFRPEAAAPLNALADVLLHQPNSLSAGERELIATYVSHRNGCYFCQTMHGAVAAAHLHGDENLVRCVLQDYAQTDLSAKMKTLLAIAAKVQQGGRSVTGDDVENARSEGATDQEIHDTVLIAAAFCMFNRYVDGLATWQPQDEALYRERGIRVAREGYTSMSREYLKHDNHTEENA